MRYLAIIYRMGKTEEKISFLTEKIGGYRFKLITFLLIRKKKQN